jgi:glycosyltransferase involved in cell wall biosynthesis
MIISANVPNPTISIVTVVYNNAANIESTILSIINQSYKNIQYIVIDGGSTDGTVDIIKKYEDKISFWVSEQDGGIYDAMNKGVKLATGEWINFINSGDSYYTNDVLKELVENTYFRTEGIDVIYGNTQIIRQDRTKKKKFVAGNDPNKQWMGPVFLHGAMFVKTQLQKRFLFKQSDKYKICADFDFIYHLFHDRYRFVKIDLTIFNFMEGGISSNRIRNAKDVKMVVLSYTNKMKYRAILNVLILRAYIIENIIIPFLRYFSK